MYSRNIEYSTFTLRENHSFPNPDILSSIKRTNSSINAFYAR